MSLSSSSCFFTSPNFTVNHKPKPHSITANYTTERTTFNPTRSQRISNPNSLYDVLGIQMGADTVEIKAAYRKLARVLHPDIGKHDSSADEFMKVHSAYATLSDPGKRADYDQSLFVSPRVVGRSSSPVGYGGWGRVLVADDCDVIRMIF